MTHGESAAVTTSGATHVCTEAIITWFTRISLLLLPASLVQVTSRVPRHSVITPLLAELSTTCMLNHSQRYNGHEILHPLAFRLQLLTVTMVIHIIICITNASPSPACIRFSVVRERPNSWSPVVSKYSVFLLSAPLSCGNHIFRDTPWQLRCSGQQYRNSP